MVDEIGGGSIRNHRPADLRSVLEIIGYSSDEIDSNFGHILHAFDFWYAAAAAVLPGALSD